MTVGRARPMDTPTTRPLPFERSYESTALTKEHALGDLVQPAPTFGARLHSHDGSPEPFGRPFPAADDDIAHFDDHDFSNDEVTANALHGNETTTAPPDDYLDDPDVARGDHARRRLLERDRVDRRRRRENSRGDRNRRRLLRSTRPRRPGRRGAPRRSPHVDVGKQRPTQRHPRLSELNGDGRQLSRRGRRRAVSTGPFDTRGDGSNHLATHPRNVTRSLNARLQGAALAAYFLLLPYVVVSKWRLTTNQGHGLLIHVALVILSVFWCGFLSQVLRNVWRLRRGSGVSAGGSAWLAGLVVALVTLVVPASSPTPRAVNPVTVSFHERPEHHLSRSRGTRTPASELGALPLALVAKRRSDLLRRGDDDSDTFDVEESIEILRSHNPDLLGHVASRTVGQLDGLLEFGDDLYGDDGNESSGPPVVACWLTSRASVSLVGFAHEGGRLPVDMSWSLDDLRDRVVALREGRVLFAQGELELLRMLATRQLRSALVVYVGSEPLDGELAACCVTLRPYVDPGPDAPLSESALTGELTSDVLVELLRADPQVCGLAEPFTVTLRRRCIEMSAYLALHRHEPVTGERLRSRVLTHADVDASSRTLANTATAIRRSLGVDPRGPRLHPVTSSGQYVTHGLASDVELFSRLVARARTLPVEDGAPLAHQALLLVKGEPLASTLRGFEWFLAEGHAARLARDGEWAALALHHVASQRGKYELAFWALQQGRLIDPYSDPLADALSRVPRLREFGGDGRRRTQNHSVGARDAVAVSWSLAGLTQKVSQ